MRNLYLLLVICLTTTTLSAQNVQVFGLSNSSDQYARRTVFDNAGNIFVSGSFKGSNFDVDPSAGTYYLNSQGDYDFFIAKYTANGTFIGAISIGGSDIDETTSLAIDGTGNLYITGWFRNTVDFDPSAGVANVVSNGHSMGTDMGYDGEIFLAKYSNNLAYQWAFNIGGAYVNDAGLSVKVNGTDVYLAGNFRGTNIDFDPSGSTAYRSAAGVIESFVAKYTGEGQYVWVSTFGGLSTVSGQVRDMGIDASENIFVLGHFDGSIDLDPGAGTNIVTSDGCGDTYVVKLNSFGQHQWGFRIGGTACDYPTSLAMEGSNFYITGYYASSNVDFNPGPATNSFSSINSNYDIFVAKYDQSGNYIFAQSLGGTGHDIGYDIHATTGSYILVGYFEGTADFNASGVVNSLTSAGGRDGFVAGYYPNGQYNNSFRFGGTLHDAAYSVNKRVANEFTITGYYQGTNIDFDPGVNQALLTSAGLQDAFFATYSVVVLPVKMVDFTANRNGKQNDLYWSTLQEQNTVFFDVQRSSNGADFNSLGQVKALGGTEPRSYNFSDASPIKGTNYYRLKIVDADGKIEYSMTRKINNESTLFAEIFPNPVNNILNVRISVEQKMNAEIVIIGVDGKVCYKKRSDLNEGITNTNINVAFLGTGTYYLRINTDREQLTIPFLK